MFLYNYLATLNRRYDGRTLHKGKTMTKKMVAILLVALFPIGAAYAHSGGTDKNGCHAGSQPYHCH